MEQALAPEFGDGTTGLRSLSVHAQALRLKTMIIPATNTRISFPTTFGEFAVPFIKASVRPLFSVRFPADLELMRGRAHMRARMWTRRQSRPRPFS